ncbi:Asp-tRNA(Asn)/Glu-tRNA(Gln) amidotransferase subunit GatA [Candidatus Bathyarchaeota archaeon]|nr:Asp-tRNA(Asn)/Glu-tRNA(Gln) amidotransferase subunit GatA [Candidatus Bathyarchaeota archaeon]
MSLLDRVRELDDKYLFMNAYAWEEPYNEGLLSGYAVSVKDNVCVKGVESKAGSKILEGYIPPFDATVVAKSRAEGAVILGKTTQDEFGFGTFNVNTPYKIPLNPHDPKRSTGGSSGGAACLTAIADFQHVAISESTGGSISCPASWCGVVGITPTYGRVSRWGLIDYANSLDKIGVMAKTVKEAAMFLGVISGPDKYDSTVLKAPMPDYTRMESVDGMRIGVPNEYLGEGIDPKVEEQVWTSIKKLESKGATVSEVSLPHTKYSLSSYYIIAMAEASTNLAKFSGLRYGLQMQIEGDFNQYFSKVRTEGLSDEAKRRVMLGSFTRMAGYRDAYYLKALKVRTKIIEDFKKAFKNVDVLAAPTMPVVAPRFDEIAELEPIQHYMMDILTVAPNLAGIPMITVPCGEVDGMPVGLHLMADHLNEIKALDAALGVEQD